MEEFLILPILNRQRWKGLLCKYISSWFTFLGLKWIIYTTPISVKWDSCFNEWKPLPVRYYYCCGLNSHSIDSHNFYLRNLLFSLRNFFKFKNARKHFFHQNNTLTTWARFQKLCQRAIWLYTSFRLLFR